MIFTTYNQTDTYYEFVGENGQKLIYPVSSIILTDDENGFIAVKNTASRQTIGLLAKPIPPKAFLTLNNSSVVTIEGDDTAVLTQAEVSAYSASLVSVVLNTNTSNMAFYGCSSLTSVTITSSVNTIGSNTFGICSNLRNVNIEGNGLKTIDNKGFTGCGALTSIALPSSVTTIGDNVFRNSTNLTSVTVNAATPPTAGIAIFKSGAIQSGNGYIYVPAESVDAYKAASGWSTYASRITAIV